MPSRHSKGSDSLRLPQGFTHPLQEASRPRPAPTKHARPRPSLPKPGPSAEECSEYKQVDDLIARHIDADDIVYMSVEEMSAAVKGPTARVREFCRACMDGKYPTNDVTPAVLRNIEGERARAARK